MANLLSLLAWHGVAIIFAAFRTAMRGCCIEETIAPAMIPPAIGPGSSERPASGRLRIQTPSKGEKRTATHQDAISAMATTAKIEKVYSPAPLRAKPIGTKPAIVTRVPVNIGKAVEV